MKRRWKVVMFATILSTSCSLTALADWYQKPDGNWIYYNDDGTLKAEQWLQQGDDWYYFDYEGLMRRSTLKEINGDSYYFLADGKMATNQWVTYYNDYFYAGADGKILKNTQTPDGYWVLANGRWDESIPQWKTPEEAATQESAETSYGGYGDIITYQAAHSLSDGQKQKLWEKTIKRTKDRLKYPNTSRFPEWNHEGISFNVFYNEKTGEDTISVSGWCEAKNGMGNYIERSIHTYYDYNTWEAITIVSFD